MCPCWGIPKARVKMTTKSSVKNHHVEDDSRPVTVANFMTDDVVVTFTLWPSVSAQKHCFRMPEVSVSFHTILNFDIQKLFYRIYLISESRLSSSEYMYYMYIYILCDYAWVYKYTYVYMCVCVCIHVYIHIYIYICVY